MLSGRVESVGMKDLNRGLTGLSKQDPLESLVVDATYEAFDFAFKSESGQKFKTYEDLMRYVNYAKAAELSIYSPDFRPRNPPSRRKKKASTPESDETEKSTDSEDSTFKLPSITSLDFLDVTSPAMYDKQSASWKEKLEKSRGSDEGCSSNMGKAKKQKI